MGTSARPHPTVGVGLWALGRWERADEERTRAAIARAMETGVGWFDTAEVYGSGRSERLLGDSLARAGAAADQPFVTTKLSWEHLRPSQVRPALLGSLQRLGRPRVDLYLVHAPDRHVPIADTMGALETLWSEGRFTSLGVSNFGLEEMEAARAALSKAELAVNQVRFSLFHRDEAEPILEYCRQHRIVVEAYTPLERGLLAGRYLDGGSVPSESRRFRSDLFGAAQFPEVRRRAKAIRELAEKASVPMASIALHWLVRRGAAPIVGASRPEHVDALHAAWATRPPDDVLDRADELARGGP